MRDLITNITRLTRGLRQIEIIVVLLLMMNVVLPMVRLLTQRRLHKLTIDMDDEVHKFAINNFSTPQALLSLDGHGLALTGITGRQGNYGFQFYLFSPDWRLQKSFPLPLPALPSYSYSTHSYSLSNIIAFDEEQLVITASGLYVYFPNISDSQVYHRKKISNVIFSQYNRSIITSVDTVIASANDPSNIITLYLHNMLGDKIGVPKSLYYDRITSALSLTTLHDKQLAIAYRDFSLCGIRLLWTDINGNLSGVTNISAIHPIKPNLPNMVIYLFIHGLVFSKAHYLLIWGELVSGLGYSKTIRFMEFDTSSRQVFRQLAKITELVPETALTLNDGSILVALTGRLDCRQYRPYMDVHLYRYNLQSELLPLSDFTIDSCGKCGFGEAEYNRVLLLQTSNDTAMVVWPECDRADGFLYRVIPLSPDDTSSNEKWLEFLSLLSLLTIVGAGFYKRRQLIDCLRQSSEQLAVNLQASRNRIAVIRHHIAGIFTPIGRYQQVNTAQPSNETSANQTDATPSSTA